LEAIIIAKLPKLSRRELEIMFGVEDLRNTRFAQELMEEATLKIIPRLLSKGFSVEEIAEIIDLSADKVREYINNMN
jgi:predicted transposase YdaD